MNNPQRHRTNSCTRARNEKNSVSISNAGYARNPRAEKLLSQKTAKTHIICGVSGMSKNFLVFCDRVL